MQSNVLPFSPARSYTFTATQTIDLGTGATGLSGATHLYTFGADTASVLSISASYGSGNGTVWRFYNVGGTRASQSATQNGAVFFSFLARGFTTALSGTQANYTCSANGLWSGTNAGTAHTWFGTLNGATSGATWMWLQGTTTTDPFGTLGIGAAPTAGNGLLQLASGATKAYGVAWGTDTFLYRTGVNALKTDGTFTTGSDINIAPASGGAVFNLTAGTANFTFTQLSSNDCIFGTTTANGVSLRTNSTNALYITSGQTAQFYGDIQSVDKNFICGTATGTKFGTGTTQKLGFWNATPVVQPTATTTAPTAVVTTGASLAAYGYTQAQADDIVTQLNRNTARLNDLATKLQTIGLTA